MSLNMKTQQKPAKQKLAQKIKNYQSTFFIVWERLGMGQTTSKTAFALRQRPR